MGVFFVVMLKRCLIFLDPFLFISLLIVSSTAEGLTRENMSDVSGWQTFLQALGYFLKMFFGSAALGTLTGLISALISFFNFGDMYVYIGALLHSGSIFLPVFSSIS